MLKLTTKTLLKILEDESFDESMKDQLISALLKLDQLESQKPIAFFVRKENQGRVLFHEEEVEQYLKDGFILINNLYSGPYLAN